MPRVSIPMLTLGPEVGEVDAPVGALAEGHPRLGPLLPLHGRRAFRSLQRPEGGALLTPCYASRQRRRDQDALAAITVWVMPPAESLAPSMPGVRIGRLACAVVPVPS